MILIMTSSQIYERASPPPKGGRPTPPAGKKNHKSLASASGPTSKLEPQGVGASSKKNTAKDSQKWKERAKGYKGPCVGATQGKLPELGDIKKDVKNCGNIGNGISTIFYSYGAATKDIRPFRDSLKPQGSMFNDALPQPWFRAVSKAYPDVCKHDEAAVLTARLAEAMAELSQGEAFLGLSKAVYDKGKGAYSEPRPEPKDPSKPERSVWLEFEFPTLQRNSAITKVTLVVPSGNSKFETHLGWKPGDGQPILPEPGVPQSPFPDLGPPFDSPLGSVCASQSNPLNPPIPTPTSVSLSQPTCNPSPTGHYQDPHEDEVRKLTKAYCRRFKDGTVQAKSEHNAEEFKPRIAPSGNDRKDDNYEFTINSVAGCPAPKGYNLKEPVPGVKCEEILFDAWKNCESRHVSVRNPYR